MLNMKQPEAGTQSASTEEKRQDYMSDSRQDKHTFATQFSGYAIDALQEVRQKDMSIRETLTNVISKEGRIIIKGEVSDIEVRLGNFERVNLNVQSRKLLDILLVKLSEQLPYGEEGIMKANIQVLRITITLDEFMALCGLSDRKNARDQFRAAAECLISLYMTFDYEVWQQAGKRRKSLKKHFSAYLFEATIETRNLETDPVVNSEIDFRFGPSLIEYLCTRYIMPVDINIFKINPHKNPHAYNLARHLSEVYRVRMNKGQPPRISVKTLLSACPELPTVEELREKGNREYWQKIYEPVERDLDAIADIYGLVDWHYCHSNGIPLTDAELGLNGEKGYSFDEWLTFMIDFTLPDYPDTTARRRKYQERRGRRAAAK